MENPIEEIKNGPKRKTDVKKEKFFFKKQVKDVWFRCW
jgi:hypothetical protein